MKKIFLIIVILFFSCQKKEYKVIEKTKNKELEKGEYFSSYTKKESFVLKYKTDTLNLFYDGNQVNRVEKVFFSESFEGDGTSGYERIGYHINKENFLDANVYITDTLKVKVITDYPIQYEERYEFYRKKYTFNYISDGKKNSNYFKSHENPSKGYIIDLLSLDVLLSKANFPLGKMPKSLYNIKSLSDEVYAGQDSLKVYELTNIDNYRVISSSIPFKYLRDIKVVRKSTGLKYFAKISLEHGIKYIDLKEIEGIQVSDPREDAERFVTASKGLELYNNEGGEDNFGNKKFLILVIPKGGRVELISDSPNYYYTNGVKGSLVNVRYSDEEGESFEGMVFSGYLSINKPI